MRSTVLLLALAVLPGCTVLRAIIDPAGMVSDGVRSTADQASARGDAGRTSAEVRKLLDARRANREELDRLTERMAESIDASASNSRQARLTRLRLQRASWDRHSERIGDESLPEDGMGMNVPPVDAPWLGQRTAVGILPDGRILERLPPPPDPTTGFMSF